MLLAARLRRLIDEGELAPGAPLPPDRALALALAVGRSTVVAAYDLLRQDGRIVRRQGSGTRVAGPEPAGVRQTTAAPIFLNLLEPGDGVIALARALLAPGDRVLVEGPTYPGALEAFREQAAVPRSLPVGLGGLAAAADCRLAEAWRHYQPPPAPVTLPPAMSV